MLKVLAMPVIIFIAVISTLIVNIEAKAQDLIGPLKEYFVVDAIEIEGNRKVESEAVLEKMAIKRGLKIDNYLVKKDMQRLYEMKYFEQVEMWHKKTSTQNILLVRLKEKPLIGKITFEGNDEISDEDLKEQVKTKEFQILDIASLKNDVSLLQKHYEEKGYFIAQIQYRLENQDNGSVQVVFDIKEWDKVIVKKVTFLGNKAILDQELKTFMQTKEESYFGALSGSGNFKEVNFQTDIERLKYLYKTRGYLQVNISNPMVTVSDDKKWVFITVQVTEGPQYSINSIRFSGDVLFEEDELIKSLKLKTNDIYNEEFLRLDIQTLTEKYQDKGHAFANVLRTIDIVPGENKVDVEFSFEKGPICYFGRIVTKGNTKTRDKVIRRELRIHEGMMYSGSKLRVSKENVNRLGFFQPDSVVFNTVAQKGKDNILDVEISIKERPTGQISLGAGYSTATNAFMQASIAQNNFRGLGQNINFNMSLASNQQIYNLGFTEPYLFDTKLTAGADYFKTLSSFISSFNYQKHGFNLRVGYPIFEYTRAFLTYRYEDNKINNVSNPTIDQNLENGSVGSLQGSLVHDKRNNIFEPTAGHFASASLEYTGVGGIQRWVRGDLEGRYYKPLWGDLIFRNRTMMAQIFKTSERGIPRIERFSLGGARNMRGFNFEDIGPLVTTRSLQGGGMQTFNRGGLFQGLTTFELEHPLIREAGLKWVLFTDIGNVYEERIGHNGDFSQRANYGFGFRWFSPIGVLRFEFGFPINKRENEAPNQFHFDIGQLF